MQAADILYLPDRMHADDPCMPDGVREVMKGLGLVHPGSGKIHFCGLLKAGHRIVIFLPRNHAGSPEPAERAAYYLLRALSRFYRTRDSGMRAEDHGTVVTGGESLSLAVALIDDYLANGLYVRRARVRTTNNGKTSWPRTIARNTAYPGAGGPVYLDLATSRTHNSNDCTTARIHALIMLELLATYGMLWLGKTGPVDRQLSGTPAPAGTPAAWITHLGKELQLSYSERDIFLIRSLIAYLEKKKGTVSGPLLIGVHKFHGLWEAMLDECLIGKLQINKRLPVPVYRTNSDDFVLVANKRQRTDTVLQNPDRTRITIVDAKYYDAGSVHGAPGWPDLVKQFFYQQAIQHLYPTERHISNHFIFPGKKEKKLKAAYVAAPSVKVSSTADCIPEYGPVHCHYQDPLELLRLYATGGKLVALTQELFSI